jgi:hypothetical protein
MTRRYLDSGRVVPHIVETVEQMERVWPLFCDLHQRRRQMLGESGCFASSNFADFHTEMAHCMLAQGKLRLHWIEFEGRPAAADYALIGDKTIFGYQCRRLRGVRLFTRRRAIQGVVAGRTLSADRSADRGPTCLGAVATSVAIVWHVDARPLARFPDPPTANSRRCAHESGIVNLPGHTR